LLSVLAQNVRVHRLTPAREPGASRVEQYKPYLAWI